MVLLRIELATVGALRSLQTSTVVKIKNLFFCLISNLRYTFEGSENIRIFVGKCHPGSNDFAWGQVRVDLTSALELGSLIKCPRVLICKTSNKFTFFQTKHKFMKKRNLWFFTECL